MPDTIIPDPGDYLSYNRYLYAYGNPNMYNDPSGHANVISMDPNPEDRMLMSTGDAGGGGSIGGALFVTAVVAGTAVSAGYIMAYLIDEATGAILESFPLEQQPLPKPEGFIVEGERPVETLETKPTGFPSLLVLMAGMTPDQQALKELVKDVTNGARKPLTREDAETVLDWAQEYNYPGWRASEGDVSDPSHWTTGQTRPYEPHIHLRGAGDKSDHIPVEPGVTPR